MVYMEPEFEPAKIPGDEVYEGTEVDPSVRALLPKGCKVQWAATHGASFWAVSHKIDVELAEGDEKSYFLKMFMIEGGAKLAEGEYEATKAWHKITPANIPEPIGFGECANRPGKHFLLLEFRDMSDDMPAANEFVAVLAKGHQKSESPTGKFGFPVTTFTGDHPYDTRWCDTWEEFFTRIMRDTMKRELQVQGPHAELEALEEQVLTKVIPRLLRPMETDGRKLRPVLVHGDLWHGNVGIDNETDEPVFYDCGSFYGHNEYDFGMWRAARYRTNQPHIRAYWRIAEITEPAEDQDDRNELYAARNDLATSICWAANKRMRQLAIEGFTRLVKKYSDGYEGYKACQAHAQNASHPPIDQAWGGKMVDDAKAVDSTVRRGEVSLISENRSN